MRRMYLTIPLLIFLGCLHSPQAVEDPVLDMEGFIDVFEGYEEYCPYFAHKEIDWKELVAIYYPTVSQCETEDEYIEVIIEMLAELQDAAIYLSKYDELGELLETVYPYIQEFDINYDMDVLVESYLEPNGWAGWEDGYYEGFGWCDPSVLPYVFLDTIPDFFHPQALDSLDAFVAECIALDVPAVIIDVRMNPYGGSGVHSCGHELMGRFTDHSRAVAIYRSRSGPEYDQYWDDRPAVFPAGSQQYTGTVFLLVGENCNDKSENLTANFMNFPNVVLVGDTTRGSVSSLFSVSVTENWRCRVVRETILTNGKHWIEGAGIPPDVFVEATEADFAAGADPVLDLAIEMLEEI